MLRTHVLLVALVASAGAGCGSLFARREPLSEAPATSETVDALAVALDGDSWLFNQDWSAIKEARSSVDGSPALARLRWTHPGQRTAAETLQRIELDPEPRDVHALEAESDKGTDEEWLPKTFSLLRGTPSAARPGIKDPKFPPPPRWHFELSMLVKRDDIAGWNAAILWARLNPQNAQEVAPVLQRLVANTLVPLQVSEEKPKKGKSANDDEKPLPKPVRKISPPMRAAAAEAWCLVLAQSSEDPETAMAPALEVLEKPMLDDNVRGELFLGIARRIPPTQIPRLADSMQSKDSGQGIEKPAAELRRAAVEACIVYVVAHQRAPAPADKTAAVIAASNVGDLWPDALWSLQWDEHPPVRKAVGDLLAVSGHPKAFEILKEQVQDLELSVRQSALINLGRLRTPAAKDELQKQFQRKEETMRIAAVQGLAAWGPAEISGFATDSSHFVRREVAVQLGSFHNALAAGILRELVADSGSDVQQASLEAIEKWPNELAVPLLLQALRDGTFKTRKLGLLQLERRRGAVIPFPLQASREERLHASATLAESWKLPSDAITHLHSADGLSEPGRDEGRIAEIQNHLDMFAESVSPVVDTSAALDWLRQLTPADLPTIEHMLPTVSPSEAEVLFHEVLARLHPAYGAVARMEQTEVLVRRQGADQLVRYAVKASLPLPVVRRMRESLVHEQDRLVWRSAMAAVLQEDAPEFAEIALLAVNHNWPDIRVLGCDYIAHHGRHTHAGWLLPLFADSSSSVQLAAVRAAAKCHNPIVLDGQPGGDGNHGLRPLLTAPQAQLRLAAAACMSQFGDAPAMLELNRASVSENAAFRKQAVEAMGKSGQTRFIEQLIRVAWTESNATVKYAAVASLTKLVAEPDRPKGLDTAQNLERTIELWVAWWADQKRTRATSELLGNQP